MAIEPFKILNDDGSTNRSEYDRCIQFLNDYKDGLINVYPQLTWSNPFEVDLSQPLSSFTILINILTLTENRLLTKTAVAEIKKLIHGVLERYGCTIHTYGNYLEASKSFTDGPGYMYDVLNQDEDVEVLKEVVNDTLTIYYLDDDNHTVIEYNDTAYASSIDEETEPTSNIPARGFIYNDRLTSNVSSYPNVYNGNTSGIYSDFQRLSGQYVGSSTLYYFSECNDKLYTTSQVAYEDDRIEEIVNFNYYAASSNKSRPARGIDGDLSSLQSSVNNPTAVNAWIDPATINTTLTYKGPTSLTAADAYVWLI